MYYVGIDLGTSSVIYTSDTTTKNYSKTVTLQKGGKSYTKGSTTKYQITAKYGQNIAEAWPKMAEVTPTSITISNTSYRPHGWSYKRFSTGSYVTQTSGNNTMISDILQRKTGGGFEGVTFKLIWTSSNSSYNVHYMFETLDGSGTL